MHGVQLLKAAGSPCQPSTPHVAHSLSVAGTHISRPNPQGSHEHWQHCNVTLVVSLQSSNLTLPHPDPTGSSTQ